MPQGSVLSHYFIFYTLFLLRILFAVIILTFTFTMMIHNYFSFKGADRLFDSKLQLEACINDICRWMVFNEFKLNQDKTELLVIHFSYCSCPSLFCPRVGDIDVAPVKAASNLGVVFDDTMSFKSHISDVCKSSFYHLRNISRIESI